MQFAIEGEAPAERVCCTGQLWEERHGWPAGVTKGRLTGIRWHPAVLRRISDAGSAIEGYGPGRELESTEDRPPDGPAAWALELTMWVPETS